MKTKQALEKSQPKTMEDAAVVTDYSAKVRRLNRRITDFEKRRRTMRHEIDAFNASKQDAIDTDQVH